MLDQLRNFLARRFPGYEPLPLERASAPRMSGPSYYRTCAMVAIVTGICLLIAYGTTHNSSTESQKQVNVEMLSQNSFPHGKLNLVSPTGSSEEDHAEYGVKESLNTAECFVTDERLTRDTGLENQLWYFREDYFFSSHHYFWHKFIISDNILGYVPKRLGEISYFMHHEFQSRYTNERWSAKLEEPTGFSFTKDTVIELGYNPHLNRQPLLIATPLQPRPNNTYLQDIQGVNFNASLARMQGIYDSLINGIQEGFLNSSNGTQLEIRSWNGINTIGAALFGIGSFPAPAFQNFEENGNFLHPLGHGEFQYIMDPTTLSNSFGAMGNFSTSLRDPVFYRYHHWIDDIFLLHKKKLEPYSPTQSEFPLLWNIVKLLHVSVTSEGSRKTNQLQTHWAFMNFTAQFGLDWGMNLTDTVRICAKHLDHRPFNYAITYDNKGPVSEATVRIFLAPRFDLNGRRLSMDAQRLLFFTLDRFKTTLLSGKHQIHRSSKQSTLTLPVETWLKMRNISEYEYEMYCGCGLPSHLLLPKGTAEGKIHDLFVMLTDGKDDAVEDPNASKPAPCQSAPVWCLNSWREYPDARPMGYPFDRRPYEIPAGTRTRPVQDLDEYIAGIRNMYATQVTIKHVRNPDKWS